MSRTPPAVLALTLLVSLATALPSQRQQRTPTTEQIMRLVPEGVELRPDIAYRKSNTAWQLDLALPKARSETPRPGIVFVHGVGTSPRFLMEGRTSAVSDALRLPITTIQGSSTTRVRPGSR